jgi:drug/metabolite transporter (DMT)-like permease
VRPGLSRRRGRIGGPVDPAARSTRRSGELGGYGARVLDDRRLGWGLAALGMLLVSTDSLFVRLAEAGAVDMAFLVSACSLPVFLVLHRRLEAARPRPSLAEQGWPLLGVGALAAISQLAFITAVTRTAVANVVVIVAAAPVAAAVVARILLGERTTPRVWAAIAVTTIGIMVVVTGSLGQPTLDGDLLAVVAIVAFAFSLTIWRRHPELSRYLGLALASAITLVITAPLTSLTSLEPRTFAAAAAMGLVFSPAGRIAHSSAPRYAPAAEVALFAPVETVAATTWAWLAFAEAPESTAVAGGVIIIAGVFYGTFASGGSRR